MRKIYFYSPRSEGGKTLDHHLYINTVPLYLTSHMRRHRPDLVSEISWARLQFLKQSRSQLIQQIHDMEIDVLCLSLYMWNIDCLEQIRGIKRELSRSITIVAGGPSVEIVRNRRFLHEHPDLDFAIFAQGEQAFTDVIDHLITGKRLNELDTRNLAWVRNGKLTMSQSQYIKLGEVSPFLENQDLLQQIVNDPQYKDFAFMLPYETSKGCAYNCSFCDWTSGLSHMTSHRRFDIEAELDMLGRLGLTNFHPSDANFGEHKQDQEIARTMARLKQEKGYPFYIRDTNLSKMKKQEAFKILEILLDAEILQKPKFAVQDIHPHVLANVDRPDVPWAEHGRLIRDLQSRYPHITCEIELLKGLPGQTRDTWEETLIQMQGLTAVIYAWILLPNSPAGYDLDWRARFGIKTMFVSGVEGQSLRNEMVIGSDSYDFRDYAYFTLLENILQYKFLADIQDRRWLFDRVRASRQLDHTLDVICQDIQDKRSFGRIATHEFVQDLFREYRDWDKTIIRRMINLFKLHDMREVYSWWDVAEQPVPSLS